MDNLIHDLKDELKNKVSLNNPMKPEFGNWSEYWPTAKRRLSIERKIMKH